MSETEPGPTKVRSAAARLIDRHVGGRIRARRQNLGVSRTELASALGVSAQQMQKYESGMSTITASGLYRVATRLGVPPSFFFEELTAAARPPAPETGLAAFAPNTQEMRQMIDAYRAIPKSELRQQIVELARTMAATLPRRSPR